MQEPRFTFQSRHNPHTGAILKAAVMLSALAIALVAAMLPRLGVDNPLIAGAAFSLAAFDFAMAFFIPAIIEKGPRVQFRFYDDRVVIGTGRADDYILGYENIAAVEEETSPRHSRPPGLAAVRLHTRNPIILPFLGDAGGIVLSFIPAEEEPLGKIKEVVEKSRLS